MSASQNEISIEANDAHLDQYFDFAEATSNSPSQYNDQINETSRPQSPLKDEVQPGTISPSELLTSEPQKDAADYADFSAWIPQFVTPGKPCDHCRLNQLGCYMSFGKVTCKTCETLFRPCSFARVSAGRDADDVADVEHPGHVRTLHIVPEDACREQGGLTGTRPLRSNGYDVDKSKKSANRFSRVAVKTLRDWLQAHADHPYPTEAEKQSLEQITGLKQGQILTWLANARRRTKVGQGKRSTSPAMGRASEAINMQTPENARPWSDVSTNLLS